MLVIDGAYAELLSPLPPSGGGASSLELDASSSDFDIIAVEWARLRCKPRACRGFPVPRHPVYAGILRDLHAVKHQDTTYVFVDAMVHEWFEEIINSSNADTKQRRDIGLTQLVEYRSRIFAFLDTVSKKAVIPVPPYAPDCAAVLDAVKAAWAPVLDP